MNFVKYKYQCGPFLSRVFELMKADLPLYTTIQVLKSYIYFGGGMRRRKSLSDFGCDWRDECEECDYYFILEMSLR